MLKVHSLTIKTVSYDCPLFHHRVSQLANIFLNNKDNCKKHVDKWPSKAIQPEIRHVPSATTNSCGLNEPARATVTVCLLTNQSWTENSLHRSSKMTACLLFRLYVDFSSTDADGRESKANTANWTISSWIYKDTTADKILWSVSNMATKFLFSFLQCFIFWRFAPRTILYYIFQIKYKRR